MIKKDVTPLNMIINQETDPITKTTLLALKKWWNPPLFEVPDHNNQRISGGFYTRDELYPILTMENKPEMTTDERKQLITHSNTVFRAMLLFDDGDPMFENNWKNETDAVS